MAHVNGIVLLVILVSGFVTMGHDLYAGAVVAFVYLIGQVMFRSWLRRAKAATRRRNWLFLV
ncbi:MAG: hypothetical protein IE926_12155 [Micrococcales bacterium]|nr:hypothetical protein [Micrococcales bacterium]